MLRGIEKWVTYFVLFIVFIFGIVFLAKQIGLTADLKESLVQATQAGVNSGDLARITHLHNSSSKVFFLGFFALCLLLIGIIMVIRGIERAYDISEVKEKVRYHLKSTTPGIVMIVLASFLLAFCSYRTSYLETVYSSRLINYNNYKIASLGWKRPEIAAVKIDSSVLPKLKGSLKKVVDVPDVQKKTAAKFDKQPAPKLATAPKPAATPGKKEASKPSVAVQKTTIPGIPQKSPTASKPTTVPMVAQKQPQPAAPKSVVVQKTPPVAPKPSPVAVQKKETVKPAPVAVAKKNATPAKPVVAQKKEAVTPKKETSAKPVVVQKKETVTKPVVAKKETAPKKKEVVVAKTAKKAAPSEVAAKKEQPAVAQKKHQPTVVSNKPRNEEAYDDRPVTNADIEWANRYQRNVTIYGYNGTKKEEARYGKVRRYYEKHDGNIMNDDLKWAYSFLEKTKNGYEPKPGELQQYENVIQRNIQSDNQPQSKQREF